MQLRENIQVVPADSCKEAVGRKRAGRRCRWIALLLSVAAIATISSALAADDSRAPAVASACLVNAAQVVSSPTATLIDVRHGADDSRVWIPGAVRASAAASRTLARTLKGEVYWIGSGKNDASLARECAALPAVERARIRIVAGGLPAWFRASGKVLGSTDELNRPLELEPAELDVLLQDARPLIVEIAGAHITADIAADQRTRVDASFKPEQVVAQSAQGMERAPIVLVVTDRDAAKNIWQVWKAASQREPFFMIDDGKRFGTYLKQRDLIATNANKPLALTCDRN